MAFVAFDVETPNRLNNSICSIGVVVADEFGNIISKKHCLVNPNCGFDPLSVGIHGITKGMVKNSPTFDELWHAELRDLFENSVLVAHNAPFDLTVLDKTLSQNHIVPHDLRYICTLEGSRRFLPHLPDFHLPTVCKELGVRLDEHHNALADAEACFGLLISLQEMGCDFSLINRYSHIDYPITTTAHIDLDQRSVCGAMTDLYGITIGIGIDGIVTPTELEALKA